MVRKPIVAGQFYPSNKEALEEELGKYLDVKIVPRKAVGIIAPHAGYMCSGRAAGYIYASTIVPKRCIVISPNHTGNGKSVAIMTSGQWQIPTGLVPIDEDISSKLLKSCSVIEEDKTAHIFEHSLEVQLPFLLAKEPNVKIVPLTVSRLPFDACRQIGEATANIIKDSKEPILIVASSDMNHYEEQKETNRKDMLAIDKVINLDPEGLLSICAKERITMCGLIPAVIMLIAAKNLSAKKAELIKYETSGDVLGDYNSVVGYAGIIIY